MAPNYALYRINSIFTLVLGCPANAFLIWLIVCRPKRELQIWSRVLLQNALIDLLLVFSAFLIQPSVVSEGANTFWVVLGPFAQINSTTLQYGGCYFHVLLVEFAKYAVAVQYFYRWLVICCEKQISIRQYAVCLGIPFLFASLRTFLLFIAIYRQSSNPAMHSDDKSETYLFAYNPSVDGMFGKMSSLCSTIINWSTIAIIVVCNFFIWRKMRRMIMPEQKRSVEISRQVGRVLLLQAIIPIALQTLPTIFFSFSVFIGLEISLLSSFLYSQTWTSCIYPVATMTVIRHYRRQIQKMSLSCWTNNNFIHPSTA